MFQKFLNTENASITLFVLLAILFFMIVIFSLFVSSSNKEQSQISEIDKIKQEYMKKVAGGTVKSIPMGELKKMKIPVPSIETQTKIVDVLDRFDALCNDLTSGLPAEIEARQKQYEYYRDKLLTFKPLT